MQQDNEDGPLAQRLGAIVASFLEGNCKGGRAVHGLNALLCSGILYALLTWAFVGQDSAWERFKRMELSIDKLQNIVTNNAQYQTETQARNDTHLTRLDGQVATLDDRTQALNTKVQVLDATTCKVGRRC